MLNRLAKVVRLAFAPVSAWNEGLQQLASFLVLIGLPAFSQIFPEKLPHGAARDFSLIVASIAIFVAAVRLQKQLDETRDSVPKLVCKGVSFHENPIVITTTELTGSPLVPTCRKTVVGIPVFYHLRIANEPTGATDRKVAEKVAARVQMFHENGTPVADERLHRWEDSPGPADAGKMADRLLPLDIPPSGIEYKLDIAMKYDEDDAFHTPNNETIMKGSPDWREEDFKFSPGTYIAEIHFRGANVASDLKCQIVNKGKGSKLEITPLAMEIEIARGTARFYIASGFATVPGIVPSAGLFALVSLKTKGVRIRMNTGETHSDKTTLNC